MYAHDVFKEKVVWHTFSFLKISLKCCEICSLNSITMFICLDKTYYRNLFSILIAHSTCHTELFQSFWCCVSLDAASPKLNSAIKIHFIQRIHQCYEPRCSQWLHTEKCCRQSWPNSNKPGSAIIFIYANWQKSMDISTLTPTACMGDTKVQSNLWPACYTDAVRYSKYRVSFWNLKQFLIICFNIFSCGKIISN